MRIMIRTDDDMFGGADAANLDREECFANYQLLCEQRIAEAYPDADLVWNVSRNTTGVQTRVSVDANDDVEDDVLNLINLVWSEALWLPPAEREAFGEHIG